MQCEQRSRGMNLYVVLSYDYDFITQDTSFADVKA